MLDLDLSWILFIGPIQLIARYQTRMPLGPPNPLQHCIGTRTRQCRLLTRAHSQNFDPWTAGARGRAPRNWHGALPVLQGGSASTARKTKVRVPSRAALLAAPCRWRKRQGWASHCATSGQLGNSCMTWPAPISVCNGPPPPRAPHPTPPPPHPPTHAFAASPQCRSHPCGCPGRHC
jgi:hypothetical protein